MNYVSAIFIGSICI